MLPVSQEIPRLTPWYGLSMAGNTVGGGHSWYYFRGDHTVAATTSGAAIAGGGGKKQSKSAIPYNSLGASIADNTIEVTIG